MKLSTEPLSIWNALDLYFTNEIGDRCMFVHFYHDCCSLSVWNAKSRKFQDRIITNQKGISIAARWIRPDIRCVVMS